MMQIKNCSQSQKSARGQGMVEFALVLPLLLLVMFAVIEFGRLLFFYSVVFTASREAARYGSAAGNVGGYVAHYQDCTGIRAAATRIGGLIGITANNIAINYDQGPGSTTIGTCPIGGQGPSLSLGNRVTVQVIADYRPILPLVQIPSFPISSVASRTILKNVIIEGTPMASTSGVPRVSFTSESFAIAEGDVPDPGAVVIQLQLSEVNDTNDVIVQINIDGSAELGTDFTLDYSSPVVIPHGTSILSIHVTLLGDTIDEYDETLILSIGGVTNAQRDEPDVYTLTIMDDDDEPQVTFATSAQTGLETAGEMYAVVQVRNEDGTSTISGKEIRVPYTWSGSAVQPEDYNLPLSPLVIPPGVDNTYIPITVVDDVIFEMEEYVDIQLGMPSGAYLGATTLHRATIVSNETAPYVSFVTSEQIVQEVAGSFTATVQLVNGLGAPMVSSLDVFVPFVIDGTAEMGIDKDYVAEDGILVIPAGSSSAAIGVELVVDDVIEVDETVVIHLGTPVNALLGSEIEHTATITHTPTAFFAVEASEFIESAGRVYVEVKLLPVPVAPVEVAFTLAGLAVDDADYTVLQAGLLTFAVDQTTARIEVTLFDDIISEFDETLILTLVPSTDLLVAWPSTHTLTIIDNDPLPVVSFELGEQSVQEDAGTASVNVVLSAISERPVTVSLETDGSALQNYDYTLSPQDLLTFAPGETSLPLTFNIMNDTLQEVDESVIVTLTAPQNATVTTPGTHTVTILASDLSSCSIYNAGELQLSLNATSFYWELTNLGSDQLVLKSVTVDWPDTSPDSPKFSLIQFGPPALPATIWSGNVPNGPATITSGSFTGTEANWTLTTGTPLRVVAGFTRALISGNYSISLVFYNATYGADCTVISKSGSLP